MYKKKKKRHNLCSDEVIGKVLRNNLVESPTISLKVNSPWLQLLSLTVTEQTAANLCNISIISEWLSFYWQMELYKIGTQ